MINGENVSIKMNIKIQEKISIYRILKRGIDIIAALIGIIILCPILLIVSIANKLTKEDNGPVFFVQKRIGQDRKSIQTV